ncbi:MAG: hypothetical protein V4726_11115 [Verrucomicrobiota bacterium]
MELPREAVGQYGLVKLVLLPDGTLKAIWKSWNATMRITRDLPRRLGLDVDFGTLHILVRSGIVRGSKFSPFTTLIDLDSLMTHIRRATGEAGPRLLDAGAARCLLRGMVLLPQRGHDQPPAPHQSPARRPGSAPGPRARREATPPRSARPLSRRGRRAIMKPSPEPKGVPPMFGPDSWNRPDTAPAAAKDAVPPPPRRIEWPERIHLKSFHAILGEQRITRWAQVCAEHGLDFPSLLSEAGKVTNDGPPHIVGLARHLDARHTLRVLIYDGIRDALTAKGTPDAPRPILY